MDAEVKATLHYEQSGDEAAFQEAASGVERLGQSASRAEAPLEQLGETAETVAGQLSQATENAAQAGIESGGRIQAAVEATTKALRDNKEGVDAAALAYEKLGGSPAEFIGRANTALERSVVLLADAEKNIQQLDEESREGLSGFADRAAKAKQRLAELSAEIEAQGDAALPELRAELVRLEAQYKETFSTGAKRAAQLEAEIESQEQTLKSLKTSAQGLQAPIGGLDDILSGISPKFQKLVIGVGSVATAFTAGAAAGKGFRSLLEGIDKELNTKLLKSFDQFIQKSLGVQAAMDRMFGATGRSREELEEYNNLLNILGTENAGKSLEELRKQLSETSFKQAEANLLWTTAKNKAEAFAGSLGFSKKALDEQAKALIENVKNLLKVHQEIDRENLGERLSGQIKGLIDGYATLGQKAPEDLRKVAEALGQLEEQTGKAADGTLSRIEELQAKLADFKERFQLSSLDFLPEDLKGEAAEEFEGIVQAMQAAGASIGLAEQEIGAKLGVLVTQFEPVTQAAKDAAGAVEVVGNTVQQAGQKVDEGAESFGTATEAIAETTPELTSQAEAAGDASAQVSAVATAAAELAESERQAKEALAQTRTEIDAMSTALDELQQKSEEAATAIQAQFEQISLGAVLEEIEQLGTALQGVLQQLQEVDGFEGTA